MRNRYSRWESFGLFLMTVLVFCVSLKAPFIWCDDYTVSENPELRTGAGFLRLWSGGTTDQYYPVTFSVYWLGFQLFGASALFFHALNITLHATTAVLLLSLLRRLNVKGALLGAALFAWHPLQVETVAWVYELKNVLSSTLLLLAVHTHLRFIDRGLRREAVIGSLLFALALLAKSAVVVYPIALILAHWLSLQRFKGKERRLRIVIVVSTLLACVSAWVTIRYEVHATKAFGSDYPKGFLERLSLSGSVFWFYIGKFLWPFDLRFTYDKFVLQPLSWVGFLPVLAALVAMLGVLKRWASDGLQSVFRLIAYYGIAIAPVLGFFNIYMMRYTYVADHLAYLGVGCLSVGFASIIESSREKLSVSGRRVSASVAIVVLTVLGISSAVQSAKFTDERVLWEESPHSSWLAHVRLGLLDKEIGELSSAESHFRAALEIQMTSDAQINLANLLVERAQFDEALLHYEDALDREAMNRDTQDVGHLLSLGNALAQSGRWNEALSTYAGILEAEPENQLAVANVTALEEIRSRTESALELVRGESSENPTVRDFATMARLEFSLGYREEALVNWKRILDEIPNHKPSLLELVRLSLLSDDPLSLDEARKWTSSLTRIAPNSFEAIEASLLVLFREKDWAGALKVAERGIEHFEPGGEDGRYGLFQSRRLISLSRVKSIRN